MKKHLARRGFLKAVPTAAGAMSLPMKIGSTPYTPVQDYPIRPSQSAAIRITDNFWKMKIATNASVTIPFEVKKLAEADRDFSVNILEAAILSLQTHEDAALAARVGRQVAAMASQNWRGNSNFEVARHLLPRYGETRSAGSGHQNGRRSLRQLQAPNGDDLQISYRASGRYQRRLPSPVS